MGKRRKNGYNLSVLSTLFSIFMLFLHEKRSMIPNARVRSATFDQNNVHNHNHGCHSSTELMEMKVSGSIEMTATMMSPTMNLDTWKFSANLTAYFVDNIAHLMMKNMDAHKINRLVTIYFIYKINILFSQYESQYTAWCDESYYFFCLIDDRDKLKSFVIDKLHDFV